MSTTSITSGTYFVGKTLIIGSTALIDSNPVWARIFDFHIGSTSQYIFAPFRVYNGSLRFVARPFNQSEIIQEYTYVPSINTYYIYVISFVSDIQLKVNIYVYNGSTIDSTNSVVKIINMPNTVLPGLNNFWLGRSIYQQFHNSDHFYNGRYDKVALYNGDLFALSDANILSNLLTLVTSQQTNIINNSTYTFRSLGTNFLGVVVDILNYNTTTGSTVTTSNITLIGTGSISGGYLNIIGSYTEPVPVLYNLNTPNKQWLMYLNTLSSISGDDLTIKPDNARNLLLEVSANNSIFMKKGTTLYNLTNLITGDVSFSNIDVSQNLNPLLPNNSSLGISGKMWGNAYIKDISLINMSISGSFSNVRQIIPQNDISTSLGDLSNMWQKAFIRDLSGITSINGSNWPIIGQTGPTGPTGPTGATGPIGPELRVNINRRLTDISNFRLTTKSRIYQNISGSFNDPIWNAVNGYYGLAKDAYPGLNPLSSGVKAVQTWTTRIIQTDVSTNAWTSLCWSPELGIYVAVANNGTTKRVMTSKDGISWSALIAVTSDNSTWSSVCWSSQLMCFVAVAPSGTFNVMYSYNGLIWNGTTSGVVANNWNSICWSQELRLFVTVASSGANRVMYSSNGIVWSQPTQLVPSNAWTSVCWSAELKIFLAVASNNSEVIYSYNGFVWNTTSNGVIANSWTCVCWSSQLGLFVAVASSGTNRVMISYNGIVWNSIFINDSNNWTSVCWSAQLELFVAVANNGYIMYSSNGTTWIIKEAAYNYLSRTTSTPTTKLFITGSSIGVQRLGWAIDVAKDANIALITSHYYNAAVGGSLYVQDICGTNLLQGLVQLTGAGQTGTNRIGHSASITNDGMYVVAPTAFNGIIHIWKKNTGSLSYSYLLGTTVSNMATSTFVTIALAKNTILDVPYDMVCVVGTGTFSPAQVGKVRVFSINKTNGGLTQIGALFTMTSTVGDNFGVAVAINGTGTTFVASSSNPAQVNVYSYNYTTSQYTIVQTIGPIAGIIQDYPGTKLALDNTGNMLAICCNVASPGGNAQAGYVRLYNKVYNSYNLFQVLNGSQVNQYYGANCDFSKDGTTIIVGSNGNLPDSFVYKKFNDSSYIEIASFSNSNISFGRSVAITGDGARVLVGNDMPDTFSGYVFVLDIATFQLKCNSVCWSPELGIFAAVANSGSDRVMTSSLKGRPPTSTNVFDSSFNRIDENGNWTFQTMAVTTMTAGGSFVTSDDRLKHNEVIITNGLDVIDKLTPKFYKKTQVLLDASYNGDLTAYTWSLESGLIAQEVLQISDLSYVVGGGDYYEPKYIYKRQANDLSYNYYETSANYFELSNNYFEPRANNYEVSYNLITQAYNLNYNSVFVYGVAAIKELHAKVKAQETTILDEQLNDLVTRIEALEHNISS